MVAVAATVGATSVQAQTTAPARPGAVLPNPPSDEQSYKKEFVYGVNFNTQAGLIGGVALRSARMLDERLLRFWSLEGVMLKNKKEEQRDTGIGVYTPSKANYAFSLRPSFGFQRILFRKAADAGVQVNGLLSAGPSIGLLLPYYITYDRTLAQRGGNQVLSTDEIVNEQYDPLVHDQKAILDRAPLFSGVGGTQVVPGFHLRGGLSFEYGRYRDAVTGVEVGFLMEAYTKRMAIFKTTNGSDNELNHQFFPSVYLTLYFGQRS
jgi:hypothetical protein